MLEQGPVRASVRQRVVFADRHTYEAVISLAARQDAALVTETSDESAPKAAVRISMRPGPGASHVYWQNQAIVTPDAGWFGLADTRVGAGEERVVCKLRPWSFWWFPGVTEWAGFYAEGQRRAHGRHRAPAVAVVARRLGRLRPHGGADHRAGRGARSDARARGGERARRQGHAREAAPPRVGVRRGLRRRARDQGRRAREAPARSRQVLGVPARRGQGLRPRRGAAGRRAPAPVPDPERGGRRAGARGGEARPRESRIACGARPPTSGGCGDLDKTLAEKGSAGIYERYMGCGMVERLPEAMLGSSDPRWARFLAAAVVGMARHVIELFLDAPSMPALGAFGPWRSEDVTQIALAYDLVAGLLSPEEDATVRRALVFGAHVLAHPDYWNVPRGMCSSNPNMTSSIMLPRGLLGALLAGHPEPPGGSRAPTPSSRRSSAAGSRPAAPGSRPPGYQAASLDGLLLLAAAIPPGDRPRRARRPPAPRHDGLLRLHPRAARPALRAEGGPADHDAAVARQHVLGPGDLVQRDHGGGDREDRSGLQRAAAVLLEAAGHAVGARGPRQGPRPRRHRPDPAGPRRRRRRSAASPASAA